MMKKTFADVKPDEYYCERCFYSSYIEGSVIKHLETYETNIWCKKGIQHRNVKESKKPIFKCDHCEKELASKQSRDRHTKSCTKLPKIAAKLSVKSTKSKIVKNICNNITNIVIQVHPESIDAEGNNIEFTNDKNYQLFQNSPIIKLNAIVTKNYQ